MSYTGDDDDDDEIEDVNISEKKHKVER